MRSSKSRSRSKSNRPRSIGNIINRVFESSGPEGKVRGTPQQIIEKYQILARDSQMSNDRVAAENFMQHAEHYTRMLAEAQRELAAEQEQRRPQGDYPQNGVYSGGQGGPVQNGGQQQHRDQPNRDRVYRDDRVEPRDEQPEVNMPRPTGMMDFIDELDDSGLVETPEARARGDVPAPRKEVTERRDRPQPSDAAGRKDRRRDDRPAQQDSADQTAQSAPSSDTPEGQATSASPQRRPRAPRKPRVAVDTPSDDKGPAEAAE